MKTLFFLEKKMMKFLLRLVDGAFWATCMSRADMARTNKLSSSAAVIHDSDTNFYIRISDLVPSVQESHVGA